MNGVNLILPPITVSKHILKLLEKESLKGSISVIQKRRIDIILHLTRGDSKGSIAKELGISRSTVYDWTRRWSESEKYLEILESEGIGGHGKPCKDHELVKAIYEIISNKKGQGRKPIISMAQQDQIVALACEKPEAHNIPLTNWTHEMLAHVAMSNGIVEQISRRHIGNILKKTN